MFNAVKYTQELEKAGFSREQAEVTLNMLHQFTEHNFATKQDIQELKHSIETLEYKMTIKLGGMLLATVGLLFTLLKIFSFN